MFFGNVMGPYAFIYMTLGYANGFFHRIYYVEDVLLPMVMITVNDLLYNIMVYVAFFMLRNRLDLLSYFSKVIVPEMVYTIIVTLFFYKLLVKINLRLKKSKEA
jgi:rod shape-determining protein MreD